MLKEEVMTQQHDKPCTKKTLARWVPRLLTLNNNATEKTTVKTLGVLVESVLNKGMFYYLRKL